MLVKKCLFSFVLILGLISLSSCHLIKSPSSSLKKVTIMLDWTPNTNHTGLYVARAKGYFKEEGLAADIIQPSGTDSIQLAATGRADFAVSYQEAVTQARVRGVPVISIAAIIQHNTSGYASLMDRKIKRPRDFEGKTYGGFGSPVEKQMLNSLMSIEKADPSKVNIVYTGNVDFFTAVKKEIDFMWIYYGWTGIEAELRGMPLNMIYLTNYSKDLDYYTPILITNEKKMKQNQTFVKKFMKAVSRGYQFAIHHPEQAANILLNEVPNLNHKLVIKSQYWLSSRYQDDAQQWGLQKRDIWQNYANWLKKYHLMQGNFKAEDAFTNEFLPKGGE